MRASRAADEAASSRYTVWSLDATRWLRWEAVLRAPSTAAAAVVLLGGALRVYHSLYLSLWLDEGYTIHFARLPWLTVMGFRGAYDVHPPLYPTTIKLFSQIAQEVVAARMVSVVAGTLTILVLYAIVSRLFDPWAGVLAALVLAASPVHIWYSQEARPYALTVLLVSLSWLALAGFWQTGGTWWAVTYAISSCLAMYMEYSAFFGLVPQLLMLPAVIRARGRRTLVLAAAGVAAILAYLPWLQQMFSSASAMSEHNGWQFTTTPSNVWGSIVALTGLGGNTYYFWSSQSAPWELWPDAHRALLSGVGATVLLGTVALAWNSRVGLVAASNLLVWTIVLSIVTSQRYPSYSVRTVLVAELGFAFCAGAAPFCWRQSRWLGIAGGLGIVLIVLMSLATLHAIYAGAEKQDFRGLAEGTAMAAHFSWPIITYPETTTTLISVYQPEALRHSNIAVPDGGALPALAPPGSSVPPAIWFSYVEWPGVDQIAKVLAGLGYEQVVHSYYYNPLYLDLYLKTGAHVGRSVRINGLFQGRRDQVAGWELPSAGVSLRWDTEGGRDLTLTNHSQIESSASVRAQGVPGNLYVLRFDARSQLSSGEMRAFLICQSSSAYLAVAPNGAGASVVADGKWHAVTAAALCPLGTTRVLVNLRNAGVGELSFRAVDLQEVQPRTAS